MKCQAHDPNTDADCGQAAVATIAHVDAPDAPFPVCAQCMADAMWAGFVVKGGAA